VSQPDTGTSIRVVLREGVGSGIGWRVLEGEFEAKADSGPGRDRRGPGSGPGLRAVDNSVGAGHLMPYRPIDVARGR
jgi:hypothetical protein